MNQYDFTEILDGNDCDLVIKQLTSIVDESYCSCCPVKTKPISPKDIKTPWITSDVKTVLWYHLYYGTTFIMVWLLLMVVSRARP